MKFEHIDIRPITPVHIGPGFPFHLMPGSHRHMSPDRGLPSFVQTTTGGRPMAGLQGRILYVEDDVRIAEITEMLLDDLGLDVTWAASAEQALKLLDDAGDMFDIVLTDVVMPGMSGVQLARRIASHWPGTPVILTSGFSEELVQGYGSDYELLQKPFSRKDLIACLRRHMGLPND